MWQSNTCARLQNKEQKRRQRNQTPARAPHAPRQQQSVLCCIQAQRMLARKERTFPFFRRIQKLGAVLYCLLTPWILSTFQQTQLRITWLFVGSFFPSSIPPVCVGEAPLGWAGLEGPFLLWERKVDRKPPRDWRECAVLLWLQVISLIKKQTNKKHQTEYESVARQPNRRPLNKQSASCLNH